MFRKIVRNSVLLSMCAVLLSVSSYAQQDPNPNSPAPVLIAGGSLDRALVVDAVKAPKDLPKPTKEAFSVGDEVSIFISGPELLPDEKANAFRVYAKDRRNRMYLFKVDTVQRLPVSKPIFMIRMRIKDIVGFWPQPAEDGDIAIYVTWRGMTSNKMLLGLGKTGGLKLPEESKTKTSSETGQTTNNLTSNYIGYRWSGDRKRLLEQATFGTNQALDQRVRRIGPRVWLEEQFNAPYPTEGYPEFELKSGNVGVGCPFPRNTPEYRRCTRDHYTQYPLITWFFREALYGEAQLKHRVAWALAQLWVTSGQTVQQSSHMIAYHKVLSENAFGNYRDLMKDMTLNPAMGDYLDMARSTRNNPNENYAREILQLFTIGLFMMNQDGTLQTDAQGNNIPTYDQETINNFTKVFTGWRFCNVGCPNSTVGAVNFKDPLVLSQNLHDEDAKTLLSYPNAVHENIEADLDGNVELDQALDNIFHHPNVGPFVSRYLIQHLVTSNPTPAYIGRVAAKFNDNGNGVRGDMKAVVKAILLDPEARGDEKTDPGFGKLREPVLLTTHFYRQFEPMNFARTGQSDGSFYWIPQSMGQLAFYPATVFNFYPPSYVIPGTTILAPEFAIMNTGTAVQRTNMSTIMAFVDLEPDDDDPPFTPDGTSISIDSLLQFSMNDASGNQLIDELDRRMMHSTMSPEMKQTILNAVTAIDSNEHEFRIKTALFLIVSSSQYMVQR